MACRVHLQSLGHPIANDTQYGGMLGDPSISLTSRLQTQTLNPIMSPPPAQAASQSPHDSAHLQQQHRQQATPGRSIDLSLPAQSSTPADETQLPHKPQSEQPLTPATWDSATSAEPEQGQDPLHARKKPCLGITRAASPDAATTATPGLLDGMPPTHQRPGGCESSCMISGASAAEAFSMPVGNSPSSQRSHAALQPWSACPDQQPRGQMPAADTADGMQHTGQPGSDNMKDPSESSEASHIR